MADFFFTVVTVTLTQLIGVLGVFFALGFLLAHVQQATHRSYTRLFGWKGVLWTAWIGTPVHELGHVFFCKIFRHNVTEVAIFQPNPETGGLGHVAHSYNKHSLYQQIGNFFIGAAPLIWGGGVIAALLVLLVPNGDAVLAAFSESTTLSEMLLGVSNAFLTLFAVENISRWDFWLFLYISFAISSHLAPSKPDQKGMWQGFAWIAGMLFLCNIILLYFNLDATAFIIKNATLLATGVMIGLYALFLSLIHLAMISLITLPIRKK